MSDSSGWRELTIYASHDTQIEEVADRWRVTLPLWKGKSRLQCNESPLLDVQPPDGANAGALTILACKVQGGTRKRQLVLEISAVRVKARSNHGKIEFGISCYEMSEYLRYLEAFESIPQGDQATFDFNLGLQ
ncbi:MAG: hypothetical protein F4Y95_11485 [Chloroflexi bacterium]|nr:hypothetical protein [Chloroflexota bacterium]